MLQVEKVLHHLLETVGKMFRRVAVSFGIVFLASIAIVEGLGFALTGKFGESLVHVVAIVIGFSLAINVALAIAIEEGLRGLLNLIKELATDAEKVAAAAGGFALREGSQFASLAEREAGQLAQGAGHLVQSVEHGAATAVRGAEHLPGQIIGGIEGGVQGVERRVTGQDAAKS